MFSFSKNSENFNLINTCSSDLLIVQTLMDVTSFLPLMILCEALISTELHTRERKKKGPRVIHYYLPLKMKRFVWNSFLKWLFSLVLLQFCLGDDYQVLVTENTPQV